MNLINLLLVASVPVVKVLLITATGLVLALQRFNVLGEDARVHLNKLVFILFKPAFVGSNLAKTITFRSFLTLWFLPVTVLLTFILGSILGWILTKLTRTPKHLKGLVIGVCSAGNSGNLPTIIIPAICNESGSPFGEAEECETYGLAYVSYSMALGAVYLWSYVYYIISIYSSQTTETLAVNSPRTDDHDSDVGNSISIAQPLLLSRNSPVVSSSNLEIPLSRRITQGLRNLAEKMNVKALLSPSTIGAILGFMVGMIPPLRKVLIGSDAPLSVFEDSAYLIGEAAIPSLTLIVGANLLQGLKGCGIQLKLIIGIMAIRYVILPLFGVVIVKGAIKFGFVPSDDPLYVFVLLLQFALPPAMTIGVMTQLFGAGQSECSVIMLWTYVAASIALTLWCTVYMGLVSS